jgi:hypothetical protein
MPWALLLLPVLLLALGAAAGLWLLFRLRRRLLPARPPARALPAGHAEGQDLLRYPARLEELEGQLGGAIGEVRRQRAHLEEQRALLAAKDGRGALAARYAADVALLGRREEGMRRVLGLVWRARALLSLRAHLAISARRRPVLPPLPDTEAAGADMELAARVYASAAERVRAFESTLRARMATLSASVPPPPAEAEVAGETLRELAAEEARIRTRYEGHREAMDRLGDTLAYLADRCRTRLVARGTPASVNPEGGSALLDEVQRALDALGELAEAGDRQMADLAVENLAEDISQLERAGLEARAEAEAAIEVEKLLGQFSG